MANTVSMHRASGETVGMALALRPTRRRGTVDAGHTPETSSQTGIEGAEDRYGQPIALPQDVRGRRVGGPIHG
jgi:hypothetical protein